LLHAETNPQMQRLLDATLGKLEDPGKKKVSKEVLLDYVREEEDNRSRCMQFPVIVLYFVIFVVAVFQHEDITNVASAERNIRNMVEGTTFEGLTPEYPVSGHKTMDDIDTATDIWTFLYDAMVPLFIPSEDTPKEDRYRVLRYNQLIGGMQLQQLRRPKTSCTDEYPNLGPLAKGSGKNPLLDGFSCYPWDQYTKDCFGPGGAATGFCPDTYAGQQAARRLFEAQHWSSVFGRRLYGPQHANKVRGRSWEAISGAYLGGFDGGLYTVPLHAHEGLTEARRKLRSLQAQNWVDTATSWFGVKMLLLNPDLAVYSHVIINVWFPPSGALVPAVIIMTFPAEPYLNTGKVVVDILWMVLWFHLFATSFYGLLKACFSHTFAEYAKSFWHWLDWLSVIGGFVVSIFWIVFLTLLRSVKARALEVVGSRPAAEAELRGYLDDADRMHSEAAHLAAFVMVYRTFVCWYTLLIAIRFFQAFMAQPRLNIITKTVQSSLVDVAHFLIVLLLVYFSFAVAGMFLFGHRMLEFSSLGMAFHQCFLIMLGSFEYEDLASEHPVSAAVWFWSYVVLVALCMLNMALAIIMDIYTEVKADADETDELWTQTAKVFRSIVSARDRVKLRDLSEQIEADPRHLWLDEDSLMDIVPSLGHAQAAELIGRAERREERLHDKGVSISDAMKMVGWIKLAVQKIERQIDEVAKLEKEDRELADPGNLEGLQFGDGAGEVLSLDPVADGKLRTMQRRLGRMEDHLGQSMAGSVARNKEMRSRLMQIEGLLKGQRDLVAEGGADSRGASGSSNLRTVNFSA